MRYAFALLLLSACGSELPRGITIDAGPYNAQEVEATLSEIISIIEDNGHPGWREHLETKARIRISFPMDRVMCGEFGLRDGCTQGGKVQATALYAIVGCTALGHEMIHVLGFDNTHSDPEWYAAEQEESLEFKIFDRVCNDRIRAGEVARWQ